MGIFGGITVFIFRKTGAIHHEKADAFAHLRRCQTHATGGVHGLVQVGNELLQAGMVGSDVLGNFLKDRVADGTDG